jgi:hypothetical protein
MVKIAILHGNCPHCGRLLCGCPFYWPNPKNYEEWRKENNLPPLTDAQKKQRER